MAPRSIASLCALVLVAALAGPVASSSAASSTKSRYTLAGGCFALQSQALGRLVAKDGSGGYAASASTVGGAEAFRMKATALGRYLFYGRSRDFLAGSPDGEVETALDPSDATNWQVDSAGSRTFRISLPSAGKVLVARSGGLALADAAGAGSAAIFSFRRAADCPAFPEVQTNAVGTPRRSAPFGEVRGMVDAHMHMMAFEFLGGGAHCARPWHEFGVTKALVDCPDHFPNGAGAVLENQVSYKNPARTHDPIGWPTFKDWPRPESLTHELSYYKWVERAWRGGLRVYVNLFVENRVLCEAYPIGRRNSCDEMTSVRLQNRRIRELQSYIDAQYGGPGKGWFRIVTNPFQARRVIARGKLAVVLGIEVSEPFGCRVYNGEPQCTRADIERGLTEVHKMGVRQMEFINKFDNALGGVAGDNGSTGTVVNQGNKLSTGRYWDMKTCTGPKGANDREQPTPFTHNTDSLMNGLKLPGLPSILPPGVAPIYPPAPHCNSYGLSDLGRYTARRMMARKMIIDPDHLGVLARDHLLSVIGAQDYSGVVSSHSWSTPDAYPRIYNLGGFVAPYAGSSKDFLKSYRALRKMRNRKYFYGVGYGADMNGLGSQGAARNGPNPVSYPFKSFDGKVTLSRQRSGKRVFDINKDGVANYGLYPDWVEDLRKLAGNGIVRDMARSSEAYLQMWERANGVPATRCQGARAYFNRRGLGPMRLGSSAAQLLRAASQPRRRPARTWRWCVKGKGNGRVTTVLTPRGRVALIASTAVRHRARKIGAYYSGRRVGRRDGVVKRRAGGGTVYLYGVRNGRIRFVAVAKASLARRPAVLRSYLRRAGLR